MPTAFCLTSTPPFNFYALTFSFSLVFFLSPHSSLIRVFSLWPPSLFRHPLLLCAFDVWCVYGQMTAGRCHTLLSPVTEESGEEGTNSEVSSPPACRSPSPGANADAPLNQVLRSPLASPNLLASLVQPSILHFTHMRTDRRYQLSNNSSRVSHYLGAVTFFCI